MATSFDKVDAGEQVFIRRKNQLYTIVPVKEEELSITPELAAKIEKARQQFHDGKTISLSSHEDINRYFESMIGRDGSPIIFWNIDGAGSALFQVVRAVGADVVAGFGGLGFNLYSPAFGMTTQHSLVLITTQVLLIRTK